MKVHKHFILPLQELKIACSLHFMRYPTPDSSVTFHSFVLYFIVYWFEGGACQRWKKYFSFCQLDVMRQQVSAKLRDFDKIWKTHNIYLRKITTSYIDDVCVFLSKWLLQKTLCIQLLSYSQALAERFLWYAIIDKI
jgi:hypothetical protein